jgi:uncharacterized repeat protein (TIGR01451 family)
VLGPAAFVYRGLTGQAVGSTVYLYATRAGPTAVVGKELVSVVDSTGYNQTLTATPTVLASAATNTVFRGLALSPQALLPDLTVQVTAPTNGLTTVPYNYTLAVANVGTSSASAVRVNFTLPAGLSFASAAGTNGFTASHSAGVVSFTGGSLAIGAQATLTVTVNAPVAGNYNVSAGAAVADPLSTITEALETNNSSTATPLTQISPPNSPPSFGLQPGNTTIPSGTTATLTAQASGNPAPTYQWYAGNSGDTSNPLSGATMASYTTDALFLAANYWVRASNNQGTANSNTATVSVSPGTNADLSALSLVNFVTAPAFNTLNTNYQAFVADTVESVTLTATKVHPFSSITVNGTPLTSGGTSAAIPLNEGDNAVTILVTAEDGVTTKSYTINVVRSVQTLPVGSISFVGFNADGDDDLAFVALTDLTPNTVIHFSDNEWNGQAIGASGAFVDFLESEFIWRAPATGLPAGTVILLNNIGDNSTRSASQGSVIVTDNPSPGIGKNAETIFAFMGSTRKPNGFLAAITTDPAAQMANTGLTVGSTTVKLADNTNGAVYDGIRSGQPGYENYLSAIADVAVNWNDAGNNPGTSLLPFPTTSFSLTSSPLYTHINRDVLNPNRDVWTSAGVTLNGLEFINLGLQGVGRISAGLLDPATGETVGSLSDMQLTGFTNNGNGTYSGSFHFLPDGGYRGSGANPNTAARINSFSFNFSPYTGSTVTTAQDQLVMTFAGSTRFTYDHDGDAGTPNIFTTSMTPTGVGALLGDAAPVVASSTTQSDGSFSNRLTVKGEGLALDRRPGKAGTGWLSEEFGLGIYRFDANKNITGRIKVPAALLPHAPVGTLNFSTTLPVNGRSDNQGFEGLAQSPDGSRLFVVLQSALVQDSGLDNETRFNTRILVYDISTTDTPIAPVAAYMMQLPRLDESGSTTNGSNLNRTAGQSAIFAMSNTALLVLSRDANGRGKVTPAPVFKSVLMVDLNDATNVVNSSAEGAAVAENGVLPPNITPVSWSQVLNLIGGLGSFKPEIGKFGLTLSAGIGGVNTLSDKWEAMSLVPCGDAGLPNDFFLFVGNDNNFQTTAGKYLNAAGTLTTYNEGIVHDSMVLAYRVRIQAPSISVSQNNVALQDGASSPLSYGTATTGTEVSRTFTVQNAGVNTLTGVAVSIDGADAASFSIVNQPATSLAYGATSSFTVKFAPSTEGVKNAVIHVASSALAALSSFDIPVTGTGSLSPVAGFSSLTSSVMEGTSNHSIAVQLSVAATVQVTVPYTFGGSAGSADFSATANSVTFAIGETSKMIDLTITDDSLVEGVENIIVTLGTPVGPAVLGADAVHTVTLPDNDLPPEPNLTLRPSNVVARVGSTITLNAAATGNPAPSFVWKKGTTVITGQTGPSLTLSNVSSKAAGAYSVEAVNSLGTSAHSFEIVLTQSTSKNLQLNAGGTTSFSVVAYGTAAKIGYQWLKNGVPVPSSDLRFTGTAKSKLSIKNLATTDSGTYTCNITAAGTQPGSGLSENQVLNVIDAAPVITHTGALPEAIVGGTYGPYQITTDPAANKRPSKFKVTGLPKGLSINASGQIIGRPTQAVTVATTYNAVKITATNGKGSQSIITSLTLRPQPCIGRWISMIERHPTVNAGLGGYLDITTTSSGSYTGKLILGARSIILKSTALTAVLNSPTVSGTYVITAAPAGSFSFSLDSSTQSSSGTITISGQTANLSGFRYVWSKAQPATAYQALHSFSLSLAAGDVGNTSIPQGHGFGTFTVSSTGTATVAGRMPDGSSYSNAVLIGPNGQFLLYQLSGGKNGSLLGVPQINNLQAVVGSLSWSRGLQSATSRFYQPGFSTIQLGVKGSRYSLVPGQNVLAAAEAPQNAQLEFSGAGIEDSNSYPECNILFSLLNSNKANLAGVTNPAATSCVITATKGTFTGKTNLLDGTVKRPVTYYGVIVRDPDTGVSQGFGNFTLTGIPTKTAPIQAGAVELFQPMPMMP